jgi:hypothetical protein
MAKFKTVLETVEKKCVLINGCWKWTGALSRPAGKPEIARKGRKRCVKRALKEELDGKKYGRKDVITVTCGNPLCCNPEHFLVTTHKENFKNIVEKRRNSGKDVLATVERKCKTKPGGCWEWKGFARTTQACGVQPIIRRDKRLINLRIALHEEMTGEILTKGQYFSTNCGNPLCCNPKHFVLKTKTSKMK